MTTSYHFTRISPDALTASDLRAEVAEYARLAAAADYPAAVECACGRIEGQPERFEVAFFPREGRAGIACGADAAWTDATSITDALDRWIAGDVVG
jgi:hypothetical protein